MVQWLGWMYGSIPSGGGGWRSLRQRKAKPISEMVRGLIDDAYEDVLRQRRRQAVERLIRLEVEDPPDAATLSRELEATHEPGGLH